jgi:hypothetical protein
MLYHLMNSSDVLKERGASWGQAAKEEFFLDCLTLKVKCFLAYWMLEMKLHFLLKHQEVVSE